MNWESSRQPPQVPKMNELVGSYDNNWDVEPPSIGNSNLATQPPTNCTLFTDRSYPERSKRKFKNNLKTRFPQI